jgi:hypothetical protein
VMGAARWANGNGAATAVAMIALRIVYAYMVDEMVDRDFCGRVWRSKMS